MKIMLAPESIPGAVCDFIQRNDKSDFQSGASRDILIISAEISKNAARAACMQSGRLIKYNEEVRT